MQFPREYIPKAVVYYSVIYICLISNARKQFSKQLYLIVLADINLAEAVTCRKIDTVWHKKN